MARTAGDIIRDARERNDMTQNWLSIAADTSQSAISQIERGEISPRVETVQRLLAALGEELVLDTIPLEGGAIWKPGREGWRPPKPEL